MTINAALAAAIGAMERQLMADLAAGWRTELLTETAVDVNDDFLAH